MVRLRRLSRNCKGLNFSLDKAHFAAENYGLVSA